MTEPQTIEKYIEPNWMIDVPLRRRGSKYSWVPGERCFRMEAKALGTRYRSFRNNKEKKAELSRTLVKFLLLWLKMRVVGTSSTIKWHFERPLKFCATTWRNELSSVGMFAHSLGRPL